MSQESTADKNVPVIELRHVDKHYGDLHVLRDVNLSVSRGEVLVVIGPSGSGKSTMCRTINRLETIDSGEILIEGSRFRRRVASLLACAPSLAWCSSSSISSRTRRSLRT